MNIVLIGFRGSGKTTVGKILSERSGMDFIDTDKLVERKMGISIPEIVARYGWPFFRELEKKVISEVAKTDFKIIAAGGGAVLDAENVQALKQNGFIIWLKADLKIISARLAKDDVTVAQRPSLTGKGTLAEIEEVFRDREAIYAHSAMMEIDTTNLDAEMVAEKILTLL